MMSHRVRLVGLVLVALLDVAVLLLPAFTELEQETAERIVAIVMTLLIAAGVVDAGIVERRRLDPRLPALADDVVDLVPPLPPALKPTTIVPPAEPVEGDDDE